MVLSQLDYFYYTYNNVLYKFVSYTRQFELAKSILGSPVFFYSIATAGTTLSLTKVTVKLLRLIVVTSIYNHYQMPMEMFAQ